MFTIVRIRRLSAGSIFKLIAIGLGCSLIPLSFFFGLLAAFGAQTVTWNGQQMTGIAGLAASPVIGLMVAGIGTVFLGSGRAGLAQRASLCTPARSARGVLESTAPTTLVAPGRLEPTLTPTQDQTRPAAKLLATIAVGTQRHLVAATRAQEKAGRTVHVHPWRQAQGAGRIRPRVQHSCCTAFSGTV